MDNSYEVIDKLVERVKANWGDREGVKLLGDLFRPAILKVAKQVFKDYFKANEQNDVIEATESIFYELVWQYDMTSPVNFNVYIKKMLYYRVKLFYKKNVDTRMTNKNFPHYEAREKEKLKGVGANTGWKNILEELSEIDIDVIICLIFYGLRQRELASIFGVGQPIVSRLRTTALSKIRSM